MNEYTISADTWFGGSIEFTQEGENREDALKKAAGNPVCLRRYYDIKPNSMRVVKKNRKRKKE